MRELRPRSTAGEGMTIARRLRLLRRHTARWFQPAIRTAAGEIDGGARDPESPLVGRAVKPPATSH